MLMVQSSRHGNSFQQPGNGLVRVDARSFGLKAEQQPVAGYVWEYSLDIVGADIISSMEPGMGTGTAIQSNGGTGTGTKQEPVCQLPIEFGGAAGGQDQCNDVFLDGGGDMQVQDLLPGGKDLGLGHMGWGGGGGGASFIAR